MVSVSKFISYNIENDKAYSRAIERAQASVQDLSPALKVIASDFYRSEKAIFKLRGPGQYDDFKPTSVRNSQGVMVKRPSAYKKLKERILGQAYPLLRFSGALEDSVTSPNAEGSVYKVDKQNLIIGTDVKDQKGVLYPKFHQGNDQSKSKGIMPLRKFLFIDGDTVSLSGRSARWMNILNTYVLRSLGVSAANAKGPKRG